MELEISEKEISGQKRFKYAEDLNQNQTLSHRELFFNFITHHFPLKSQSVAITSYTEFENQVFIENTWSYGILLELTNKFCSWISSKCGAGCVVAIHLPINLGILFQFCLIKEHAVLPLNLKHPIAQKQRILQKVQPELLITINIEEDISLFESVTHALFFDQDKLELIPIESPKLRTTLYCPSNQTILKRNIIYCIPTSGSTKDPEIVNITSHSLLPNIIDLSNILNLDETSIVCLASPLTFDPSLIDLLATLASGAQLCIMSDKIKSTPSFFTRFSKLSHYNVLQTTPSYINTLVTVDRKFKFNLILEQLSCLLLGGEIFPTQKLFKSWISEIPLNIKSLRIFNIYGTTEVSVWAMIQEIQFFEEWLNSTELGNNPIHVPLGCTLSNTIIRLVNVENPEIILYPIPDQGDQNNIFTILNFLGLELSALPSKNLEYIEQDQIILNRIFGPPPFSHFIQQNFSLQNENSLIIGFEPSELDLFRLEIGSQSRINYLNELELTETKGKIRWRDSGDLVQISSSRIYYYGREHIHSIKIFGQRINTIQIGDLISTHPLVDSCIVIPKKICSDSDNPIVLLYAFLVLKSKAIEPGDQKTESSEKSQVLQIERWATMNLSDANRPVSFLVIPSLIPSNSHGKVDIQYLYKLLDNESLDTDPQEDIKSIIRDEWQKLKFSTSLSDLVVSPIDFYSDQEYFAHFGTSIDALLFLSRLDKRLINTTQKRILTNENLRISLLGALFHSPYHEFESSLIAAIDDPNLFARNSIDLDSRLNLSVWRIKWTVPMGKCVDASPLIIKVQENDEYCIVSSHSGVVASIHLLSGLLNWTYELNHRVTAKATQLGKDTILVPTFDGKLFVFEILSGTLISSIDVCPGFPLKSSCVVLQKNNFHSPVILGSYNGSVYFVNIKSKLVIKIFETNSPVLAEPLIDENSSQIVIASQDGNVYFIHFRASTITPQEFTFCPIFNIFLEKPIFADLILNESGQLIVINVEGVIHCIDISTHKISWIKKLNGLVFSSPLIFNNTIVCATNNGNIFSILISDGEILWNKTLSGHIGSKIIFHDGILKMLVFTTEGILTSVEFETGESKELINLSTKVYSSPALSERGDILVGTRSNSVICLTRNG